MATTGHYNLDSYLQGHVFAFLLIFCRTGTVLILFPGVGEIFVNPRVRLFLAFAVAFLLLEPLLPILPPMPAAIPDLVRVMLIEIMIGLFYGTMLRLMMDALEFAGAIIGIQTGLSNAQLLNPLLAQQSQLSSTLLSISGLALVFATGLYRDLLGSLRTLYEVFPPGQLPDEGDMLQSVIHTMTAAFKAGIIMASPFLAMGILLFTAMGIVQKLLPSVQLFLAALPLQIWGGLTLIAMTMSTMMAYWLGYMGESLSHLGTQ